MRSLAFRLGRTIGKHPLASRIFCWVEPALPLKRLGRSTHCVAFMHPRPSYNPHILIVPTTPFPSLISSGIATDAKGFLLWEMIELAREAVGQSPESDWQLIVNGGTRQEIGQVHGHLIHTRVSLPSDRHVEVANPAADLAPWMGLFEGLDTTASRHDNGYSLVFDLSAQGPVTAWMTESNPA